MGKPIRRSHFAIRICKGIFLMTERINTKVLVVGGGPGGYVAAIRAGQLGLDTIIVEADTLGGTCLIRGCIPSKAMIHVAGEFETMAKAAAKGLNGITLASPPSIDMTKTVAWKNGITGKLNAGVAALLKRAKVRVVQGWANFSDAKTCQVAMKNGETLTISAENVILANGSLPVALPHLPFAGPVISSTEALSLDALPKKLVVVGAGYIGLELGIAFRKMGAEVAVVEMLDRILPLYDAQLVEPVHKWLTKHGVELHLGAKAKALIEKKNGAALAIEKNDGSTLELPADKILVTVGRKPNTEGWGLENMAVDMDGRFVRVGHFVRVDQSVEPHAGFLLPGWRSSIPACVRPGVRDVGAVRASRRDCHATHRKPATRDSPLLLPRLHGVVFRRHWEQQILLQAADRLEPRAHSAPAQAGWSEPRRGPRSLPTP